MIPLGSKRKQNREQEGNLPKIEVRTFKRSPGIVKMPADIRGNQLTVPKERLKRSIGFGTVVQHSLGLSTLQSLLGHGKWSWRRHIRREEIRYMEQASEVEQLVWKINFCPMEIGSRGFEATQTARLLKDLRPGFATDINKVSATE